MPADRTACSMADVATIRFSDFRPALISRGRRAFETGLSDPNIAHRAYDYA